MSGPAAPAVLRRRLAAALAALPAEDYALVDAGGFRMAFCRVAAAWWLSGAVPLPGAQRFDVEVLRAAFAERGRRCEVEWVEGTAPGLAEALAAAGAPAPDDEPLLVLDALVPPVPPAGAVLRWVAGEEAVAALGVLHEVFGLGPVTAAEAAWWVEAIAAGRLAQVAAVVDGTVVAAAHHGVQGGARQVAGVVTLPSHRRRGLGAAVTAAAAADARERGADLVFLAAADDAAARLYTALGFRRAGTARSTTLPTVSPPPF